MFNDSYDHEGFFKAADYADLDAVIINPLEYVEDVTTKGSQYAGDGVIAQVIDPQTGENQILLVTRPAKMVVDFKAGIGKAPQLRKIVKVDVAKSPTGYSWVTRNVNPGTPARAAAIAFLEANPDALIETGAPVVAGHLDWSLGRASMIPAQRPAPKQESVDTDVEEDEAAALFA